MIQGLLATARLQTGKAESVSVDLGDLVAAKIDDFAPVSAGKSVTLSGHGEGVVVLGVETALDRALSNLVENAIRAAPPGSEVVVGSGQLDGWAWLGVADSGPGLPAEPGDRVGLGLSIVTQIAEGHGGSLASFAGSEGRGTTMVVWIPKDAEGESPPSESPFTVTS